VSCSVQPVCTECIYFLKEQLQTIRFKQDLALKVQHFYDDFDMNLHTNQGVKCGLQGLCLFYES